MVMINSCYGDKGYFYRFKEGRTEMENEWEKRRYNFANLN